MYYNTDQLSFNKLMNPLVKHFFDSSTHTFSYVVYDAPMGRAAIIDSVLDFDAASASTSTRSAEAIVRFVIEQGLKVDWILETHAHADHLSAAPYLKSVLGGYVGIGAGIKAVQRVFKGIYNLGAEMSADGAQFDRLFSDGDTFALGALQGEVIAVPGHTPADVAYKIGDALFVGDTLFMPDVGTARCDFPGGDAAVLYDSVHRLLAHPSESRIFVCHDYPPKPDSAAPRAPRCETSIAEQRAHNIHVRDGVSKAQFVEMRKTRDATLAMPALMLPSVQVNIQAGHLPREESNGVPYLKIPVNLKL
jgi:glyoxylase-like metal-dependent hydrolase (beta-lactamase superfamily II)